MLTLSYPVEFTILINYCLLKSVQCAAVSLLSWFPTVFRSQFPIVKHPMTPEWQSWVYWLNSPGTPSCRTVNPDLSLATKCHQFRSGRIAVGCMLIRYNFAKYFCFILELAQLVWRHRRRLQQSKLETWPECWQSEREQGYEYSFLHQNLTKHIVFCWFSHPAGPLQRL